jgi:hypothetical protein
MNKLPWPNYQPTFDEAGAIEAYTFLREFYNRYPSGAEVGEALYQVRRDLDLIPDHIINPPEKKPRTRRTTKSNTEVL